MVQKKMPPVVNFEDASTEELVEQVKTLRLYVAALHMDFIEYQAQGEVPDKFVKEIGRLETLLARFEAHLELNTQENAKLYQKIVSVEHSLQVTCDRCSHSERRLTRLEQENDR